MERTNNVELSLLYDQLDERLATLAKPKRILKSAGFDNMDAPMSIPEPMCVSANNGMSGDDFNVCSSIVSVCRNMIQRTIVDANQDTSAVPVYNGC